MKKILCIILLSIVLCGCNSEVNKTIINQDYIEQIVMGKDYVIIDVRTEDEYNEVHIKDSINLPVDEIDKDIKLDKEKIIFVYCRSGNRSSVAYESLTNLGYTVYDLGGIDSIDLDKVEEN